VAASPRGKQDLARRAIPSQSMVKEQRKARSTLLTNARDRERPKADDDVSGEAVLPLRARTRIAPHAVPI
jgi:hypothetical protein